MKNPIKSLLGTKKKIGCSWASETGKVIGYFIVTPIEKTKTQMDSRDYYSCEFNEVVFVRIVGGKKYSDLSNAPEALKKEVTSLIGSRKIISSDVLNNGTLVYTERPEL